MLTTKKLKYNIHYDQFCGFTIYGGGLLPPLSYFVPTNHRSHHYVEINWTNISPHNKVYIKPYFEMILIGN